MTAVFVPAAPGSYFISVYAEPTGRRPVMADIFTDQSTIVAWRIVPKMGGQGLDMADPVVLEEPADNEVLRLFPRPGGDGFDAFGIGHFHGLDKAIEAALRDQQWQWDRQHPATAAG